MSAAISRNRVLAAGGDPIACQGIAGRLGLDPNVVRFTCFARRITATLGCYLTCLCLLSALAQALDPNKRITQYIHTSWRKQEGSAPSGMYAIAQTSDAFLWFLSSRGEIWRFDGVQFRPWYQPGDAGSIGKIGNIVGGQQRGLWALGAVGIAHLKAGVVTSHLP